MTYFGMKDRFSDDSEVVERKGPEKFDTISYPSNDSDIEGIYRYLGWHMYKAGMSSNCFHFLEVLKRAADLNLAGEQR